MAASLMRSGMPSSEPGYSFATEPHTASAGPRQHGFYPYVLPFTQASFITIPANPPQQLHRQRRHHPRHHRRRLRHPRRRHPQHQRLQHQLALHSQTLPHRRHRQQQRRRQNRPLSRRLRRRWQCPQGAPRHRRQDVQVPAQ